MRTIIKEILAISLAMLISSVCPFAHCAEKKEVSCSELDSRVKADPSKARTILDTLYSIDCLGGQKDDWEYAQNVKISLESVPTEGDVEVARTKIASELRIIRAQLLLASLKNNPIYNANTLAINKFEKNDLAVKDGPDKPKYWEYHPADGKTVGIDVTASLKVCTEPTKTVECLQEYEHSKQIIRFATVTKRTLDYFSMRDVHMMAIHVNMLEKQWDHYFNDARAQFIWELGFNAWRYKENNEGKEGLLSPPSYQWILLHPSVGLEYVGTKAGDRFRETVVLEGVGINTWTWNDSKMKRPLGISVIGVYGDRSSVPQFGYGALFHYDNNLSLGVTRRGSETGVILSLDLAKLFLKQDGNKKYEFKYRIP